MNRRDWNCDEALIEAIQRGDGDAAACLYHRHIDRVHRICYRIVLDPSQVPDCVQEVWLKVFRGLGRFRCERSFVAWLNSVTANTAIDYYRRCKRRGARVDLDDEQIESLTACEAAGGLEFDEAMTQERIREALEQISVSQRTAFVLRYFEDMPLPQIARTLGCREGTARTHIRRCVLALRAKLAIKLNR
jgi:RNA polymerase sigma-70 factor (ECF subfamily)